MTTTPFAKSISPPLLKSNHRNMSEWVRQRSDNAGKQSIGNGHTPMPMPRSIEKRNNGGERIVMTSHFRMPTSCDC